jgi:hypothetical protein
MPKFKNVSPLGALDLPLIGRVVDRGEVIELTAAQAKHVRGQTATWEPVRTGTRTGGQEQAGPDAGTPDAGTPGTDGDEQLAATDPQSEE